MIKTFILQRKECQLYLCTNVKFYSEMKVANFLPALCRLLVLLVSKLFVADAKRYSC